MLQGMNDFQHVTVSVSSRERSLAFYRDVLGFAWRGRLSYGSKGGLLIDFLDMGSAVLEVFSFAVPTRPSDWRPDDMQRGLRHIALRARSTDDMTARLKKAGVQFTLDPITGTGGGRIAFFKDPDGTLIEIVEAAPRYHTTWVESPRQPAPVEGDLLVLDHVSITVSRLDSALRFYHDLLGLPVNGQLFKEDERGFTMTFVQAGSVVLELFSFDKPTIPRRWDPDETVLGLKHLGFVVDDVVAVADRLKAAAVPFIYQPADALGNVKTAFFEDQDGNALELIDGVPTYDA